MVNPGPFPETLPVTGSLAVAVLQPVVPGLTAANDNDEPEPPGAAAAPVPRRRLGRAIGKLKAGSQ